ncbi:hypothetical protein [Nannocystis bainbridge]|uniref:Uncharacterized protein n=1 Tax=Nannocystis bainbridge TaxID=2995303 RepID=A0ABT5DR46_9BACT|nr:hypothetical protein [Nannocystis bainbridge]MDC0715625.1 hypothetical protein [Nannocystis bainbridge]
MRRRIASSGWSGVALLLAWTVSARAEAAPASLGEQVQQMEALDRQIAGSLRGFPGARPMTDAVRKRVKTYRSLARRTVPEVALQGDAAMQRAVTGLDFSALLQGAARYRPWATERLELRDRAECRAEVGLGRHFARYAAALATKDELAAMLVLSEYQNALNCLTAWQVAAWTDILGHALRQYEASLQGDGFGKSGLANFRVAVFNLVLLTVDLAKHAGPNAAHRWAQAVAPEVAAALAGDKQSVYLFDPLRGEMIGRRADVVDLRLVELLRDRNIGAGACGFSEMLATAEAGGSPACGRGLGCATGETKLPGGRGDHTPFGLKSDALRASNCSGAGGSGGGKGKGGGGGGASAGGGSGPGPFGATGKGTSIGSCAATAAVVASWQMTTSACTLAQAMSKKSFEVGKLPQGKDLPVRGFYGEGGCGDPRTVGDQPAGPESSSGTVDETELDFATARKRSADWLRTKEGEKYVVKAAQDTISAAESRERLNHAIDGSKFPKERADYYQGLRERVAKDGKILAEAAARAVETASLDRIAGKDVHGAAGITDDATNRITIDRDVHPDVGTMQSTLEHEAVHVVANTMNAMYAAELTQGDVRVRFNEADGHAATRASLRGGYVERYLDLVGEEAEAEQRRRTQGKGGRNRRPGIDGPGRCGAAAAAVAEFMACRPGTDKPLPKSGGLTPSPGLTPPAEGPSTASGQAFMSCLHAAGVGVAVGDAGTLQARAQATSPTGCAAMKCSDGAAKMTGGSGCRCTAADGLILPDLFSAHLCQHSDACVRQPVLGGDAPKFDARAIQALQEWAGLAPPPKP